MQLFDLPHADARRLLDGGAPVWLSVNPVEYHGPHLSLHNDRLVSEGLIRDLHARIAPGQPLLVAADLELGVEPCWGPGTRHVRFADARRAVREACRALAELGAKRVAIMTFHGAPLHNHALDEGVRLLQARGVRAVAPFHLLMQVLVDPAFDGSRFASALVGVPEGERAAMLADLRLDFHAGFFETSLALHYAPASVSPAHRSLAPCPSLPRDAALASAARVARALGRRALAAELDFAAYGVGWYSLRPFPGYTGRPHLASAEAGAAFARFIVDEMAPVVARVLDGDAAPPRPIMTWLPAVSLGGRLGHTRVTPDQMLGID